MKRWLKIIKVTCLLFATNLKSQSQELLVQGPNYGINLGVNFAFGTHFQRFGFTANAYYLNDFVQANSEIRFYYSFKNLGPRFINPEIVLSQGVVFGYGSRRSFFNPFVSTISNQTTYNNSIVYVYSAYFNTVRTTQQTGIVAFQFGSITIVGENDLLARPVLDRYRTGAFLLQYQHLDQFQAALNCTMWTGMMGQKSGIINPRFYYDCFMDTLGGIYPNYSNGLLSAQFKFYAGYGQNVQVSAGVDAEQVRQAVQNTFIHDMRWIPKKYNKARNCHIPMINDKGVQYFFGPEEKIRSPRPYFNVFTNPSVFY